MVKMCRQAMSEDAEAIPAMVAMTTPVEDGLNIAQ
jgi:hypothetical protein